MLNFESKSIEVFKYQYNNNLVYKSFCDSINIKTENIAWLGNNVDWLSQIFPNVFIANLIPTFLIIFGFYIISRNKSMQLAQTITKTKKIKVNGNS